MAITPSTSNSDFVVQYSYVTGLPVATDCATGLAIKEDLDAATVIQYCLDKGGKTYIAEGVYEISRPLYVKFSYTSVVGAGGNTVLNFTGASLFSLLPDDTVTKAFCFFEKFRIKASVGGTAFDFTNLTLCKISDVWMEGLNTGIKFSGPRCLYNAAENVRIGVLGENSCAIKIIDRANHTRISNARILPDISIPSLSTGVYMEECSVIELESVDVEHNALYAMDFANKSSHCCVVNCWLEGNNTNVRLQPSAVGITFIGGAISAAKFMNIEDEGAVNTTFLNTRIQYKSVVEINGVSFPGILNEVNLNGASLIKAKIKGTQATVNPLLSQMNPGFFEVWENTASGEVKLYYKSVKYNKLMSVMLK